MSDYYSSQLNNYAVYSPQLSDIRLVQAQHTSLSRGLQSVRLVTTGMLVSALIVAATHIVQLRSSALAPANHSTSVSQAANTAPKPASTAPTTPAASPITTAVAAPPQPDSAALQAVLNKWNSDYPSGKFGVAVSEINGLQRSASLNSHTSFEAASLYKLYEADYVYNQIAKGTLSSAATFGMSRTIANCMKPLIVVSDNACGEGMGYGIGWQRLNSFAHAAGFNETILSPVNTTTASDVAKYLQQLQAGTLINSADFTQQLLANMKVQIFRSAIPAGVPGVTVADKVGFNFDNWHDAAIVYGPKSTYILVVMTKNSSTAAAIKDLSTRVATFFNQ